MKKIEKLNANLYPNMLNCFGVGNIGDLDAYEYKTCVNEQGMIKIIADKVDELIDVQEVLADTLPLIERAIENNEKRIEKLDCRCTRDISDLYAGLELEQIKEAKEDFDKWFLSKAKEIAPIKKMQIEELQKENARLKDGNKQLEDSLLFYKRITIGSLLAENYEKKDLKEEFYHKLSEENKQLKDENNDLKNKIEHLNFYRQSLENVNIALHKTNKSLADAAIKR